MKAKKRGKKWTGSIIKVIGRTTKELGEWCSRKNKCAKRIEKYGMENVEDVVKMRKYYL